jgi:hypothetical protein
MKTFINRVMWALISPRLEADILNFCKTEYKSSEVNSAYHHMLSTSKKFYLERNSL